MSGLGAGGSGMARRIAGSVGPEQPRQRYRLESTVGQTFHDVRQGLQGVEATQVHEDDRAALHAGKHPRREVVGRQAVPWVRPASVIE